MKAILISDHAKWCALTMNGIKKIEVRKENVGKAVQKLIDEQGFADIYVYCSMAKHIKDYLQIENGKYVCNVPKDYESELNGKVIFKFRCYNVEKIMIIKTIGVPVRFTRTLPERDLCVATCLTPYDFKDYLRDKNGCAIYITNLKIFDKPKELSEFYTINQAKNCSKSGCPYFGTHKCKNAAECSIQFRLTKAPQSFAYIEVE